MIWSPLLMSLLSLALPVLGQDIVYDSAHNTTPIIGTWSSGSKAVQTGSGFANPANMSFIYPKTAGVSYSFSDDGYYEIARYRFVSNGSQPNCITGTMVWVHGKYELVSNGSIIATPLGDGYQQVQDPCAAESNLIQNYNYTELFMHWQIFTDPTDGYKLHLFEFDGTPVAPLFQISADPNMLPTQMLRNVTPVTSTDNELTVQNALAVKKKSDAPSRWNAVTAGTAGVVLTLAGAVASLV